MNNFYIFLKKLEKRLEQSTRIREKNEGKIPVIVEKGKHAENLKEVDTLKLILPPQSHIADLLQVVQQKVVTKEYQQIYLKVGKEVPAPKIALSDIYEKKKDEDGFLYVTYEAETPMG